MDWKSLGPIIGAVAPLAGSILGGLIPFPGGSLIGQKFGEIIARQFGVDPASPTAAKDVSDRIVEAGEETARAKINAATEQARAQIEGFVAYERAVLEAQVKNLSDVNVTMRAETAVPPAQREHWFFRAWRPAFAWVFIAVYGEFGAVLGVVTLVTVWRSPAPLDALYAAWPLFLAYFGPGAAMVGVLIPSRSIEKKAAIENAVPMPNAKPAAPPVKPPVAPVKPATIGKPVGSRD